MKIFHLPPRIIVALLACYTAVVAQPTPHIAAVVSGADFKPGIALDGYATIFGSNLSDIVHQAVSTPYPTSLGPTQVAFCLPGRITAIQAFECQYVQLVYAGPTQINFLVPAAFAQLPGFAPPNLAIVVSVNGIVDDGASAGTNAGQNLGLQVPEPRIFFEGYDCFIDARFQDANKSCGLTLVQGPTYQAYRGAVTDQLGRLLTSSNPARFGQYYTIWMTGLGAFANGKPNPALSMALTNIPTYAAGGRLLPGDGFPEIAYPSYIGASPVYPGLYQINFQLLAPLNSDGPPDAFPCGQYSWEFSISIIQGLGSANLVQIPILVKPGDVPCGQ